MLTKLTKVFLSYIFFLFLSLIFWLWLWATVIDGKLFYCSDSVIIGDFIPPFVHGAQYGDHWIASPSLVWSIWYLFIALIFITPYFLVKKTKTAK